MRISRPLTIAFAGITLLALLAAGYLVSRPRGSVIAEASFSHDSFSPNADGETDVTVFSYRLRRGSIISLYFEDEDGNRYEFRKEESRNRGEYSVQFGGVVDGFVHDGEAVGGQVISRLLPDGAYTWTLEAQGKLTGRTYQETGTLLVDGADPLLPDILEFTVSPEVFTPNQDGINDLVWINAYIPKDADLDVYLIDDQGVRYFVPESQQGRKPGEEGRHTYQWDGGVDLGKNPPADGTYQVLAEARDAEGQLVRRSSEVSIEFGGVPLAEIVAQPVGDTVEFSSRSIAIGDTLFFELTVENYGDAPIRTTGPEPGYVYDQDDLFATTGYYEESGAWRVGIHCQTCLSDYPWRWALGTKDSLTPIEANGQIHYYLMPGERAVVTGGVRLLDIVESRNPQQFWAGLIHEDVGIAPLNQRVGPQWIEIVPGELLPDSDS